MYSRLQAARKDEGGFSLIELLIVIVVLGILGGIVVFGVGTFRSDSQAATCEANKKTVEVAATAYSAKEGQPAADMDALMEAKLLEVAPDGIDVSDGEVSYTGVCVTDAEPN